MRGRQDRQRTVPSSRSVQLRVSRLDHRVTAATVRVSEREREREETQSISQQHTAPVRDAGIIIALMRP